MTAIIVPVLVLGIIALVASVVLYVCSKKFAVEEDTRLPLIIETLPGANCGGCGFPGCAGLAGALIKASDSGSIDGLSCPVGGEEVMDKIVNLLSMAGDAPKPEAKAEAPKASAASGEKKPAKDFVDPTAPKEFVIDPKKQAAALAAGPINKPLCCPDGNKPANIPAGAKPADMNTLKSI